MKQQSDLDDARELTAFWTYFKENHTVVIGNKHKLHWDSSQKWLKYARNAGIYAKLYYYKIINKMQNLIFIQPLIDYYQ